ncbi:DUF4333 domain-containing protein [Nocardiopsis halophila]|uniref:DUF4333 domain-containing protein n=1 Tax=Nocardiopsis halophila TaxID=141692 RepID=UPI0003458B70|nr:DUF4333 domain-containing protein [Nocardiopsis halophila]
MTAPLPQRPQRPHRRSGRRLAPVLAGTALAAAFAATGCEGAIDGERLEEEIASQLESELGRVPDSVECPGGSLDAEDGAAIECEVTAGEQTYDAAVTVTGVQDGNLEYSVELDETPSS